MAFDAEKLLGSWLLDEWVEMKDGAPVEHPFGKEASGRLFYAADGSMAAFLGHEDWPKAAADTPATLDQFFAYAGTYQVNGAVVSHLLDNASLPFMVGVTLIRKVIEVSDEKLVLEADIPAREDAVWHLIWKRA